MGQNGEEQRKDFQGDGVQEGKGRHDDLQSGGVQEGEGHIDIVHDDQEYDDDMHDGLDIDEGNVCGMNEGGIVSSDVSEDESIMIALEIASDDSDDNVDCVDEKMDYTIEHEDSE